MSTFPTNVCPHKDRPEFKANWDIFCRVIDNFGDIGITWRLARILATEYRQTVRLWVDDPAALAKLVPDIDPLVNRQHCLGIEIRLWSTPFPDVTPATVVIEAFACALPENYVRVMAEHTRAWFNLEYFTAEPWAAECHGLPSPQPNGVPKIFAIPGIAPGTGGLLREADLLAERQRFLSTPSLRQDWATRWRVPLPVGNCLTVFLFGYENAALSGLLQALATHPTPVVAYLPEGRLLTSARMALNLPTLSTGDRHSHGNLTLHILPFLPQHEFDRLLWLCDLNFVRGEDSLARAIWAGKPFIWQIYPTADDAHWIKLDALLDTLGETVPPTAQTAWRQVSHDWNAETFTPAHWQALVAALPELHQSMAAQTTQLARGIELAQWLVKTAEQRLQCATI
ncbi:hypothetical protein A9404_12485 [Halothiobacillus diazotrophicus]|uniref:Protein-arginine rhamnosyltransferase n=1 Tax=Halothiobacillus diazotrophicus TaxID=1860122 RepID=A0A191ZJS2_9GAMM|nr:elongation factor P maturation arginine rhamnosyltransferase EarP [Halothiobacillus diazotrophicus]ANJ68083.1 hypothetical protein A9404_12485 [Halothiobacillus diazotrophicus]